MSEQNDNNMFDWEVVRTREVVVYIGVMCLIVGVLFGSLLVKSELSKPIQPEVIYTGDVVCD